MTIQDFKTKWRDVALRESAVSQEHFIDLCQALDVDSPAGSDLVGSRYNERIR